MAISIIVNDREVCVDAEKTEWTLVRFLREGLGLTGTKQSCDNEGTCGTCTVIIDGEARRSCLEKVGALDGSRIETVESLAVKEDGNPHPLLQAVIQDGIFQCGYCSAGALMTAKALLDRNPDPSDELITQKLSGIVCRCAGLYRMNKAVKRAAAVLRGELTTGWTKEDTENEHMWITKLTGVLRYTDDLSFPGMVYGKALRSPLPHAIVKRVDVSKAEKIPGIIRILTAKDIPGTNRYGLLVRDQPILCDEIVRHVGDALALVIGETPEALEEAIDQIELDLESLPILSDPVAALQVDAPVLHDYLREKNPEEHPNVLVHHKIRKGDIKLGFDQADIIMEGDYRVPFIDHAYMELECSIGVPEGDGEITVYCGSQGPTKDREQVSEALGIPLEKVRIAHQYVGGGFGGKEDVSAQVLAALGAWVIGRPVKVLFSRRESFLAHGKRHAETMHHRVGVNKDGRIMAVEVEVYGDTGAYASTGEPVLYRSGTFAAGPHVVPHVKVDTYAVHTNNPFGSAFRGFGGTQLAFSSEVHLQKIIDKLGMDAFDFRIKNALRLGDATITGHVLTEEIGQGYVACLEALRKAVANLQRPEVGPSEKLGIGIAGAYKNVGLGSGLEDDGRALITLENDGTFMLRHGSPDIGQGANEAMAIIFSKVLGIPLKYIRVHAADTKLDPLSGITTASRVTFVCGNAVLDAAQQMKDKIWQLISDEFSANKEDIVFDKDGFANSKTGQKYLSLKELANGNDNLMVEAFYEAPETDPVPAYQIPSYPDAKSMKHKLHFSYCYGAQAVMVAVNEITGEVRVLKVIAAHDVGKILSKRNCIGQIEGAVVQGLGYALSEAFRVEKGQLKTQKFEDLGLLRLKDIPEIETILVEDPHPLGPMGAKGLGELALTPTAPAVVNAIHDAVGIWVNELPVTREKILQLLQEK